MKARLRDQPNGSTLAETLRPASHEIDCTKGAPRDCANVAAQARRACGLRNETETRPRRCLTLPCSASAWSAGPMTNRGDVPANWAQRNRRAQRTQRTTARTGFANRRPGLHVPLCSLRSPVQNRISCGPNVAAQARRACGIQHETGTSPRRCLTLPGWARPGP
jgi:hypothetical protein